jgi:transglutaminase-like putative cysteine protease
VPLFDPYDLAERDVVVTVGPESTLVVPDSAGFDSTTMTWTAAHLDTIRAFRIDQASQGLVTRAWVDGQGRLVRETGPTGLTLERSAYEIAYVNFHRRDTTRAPRLAPDGIARTTALAAGVALVGAGPTELRVRLSGADLSRLHLEGGRQSLQGDTLIVRREPMGSAALQAAYALPARDPRLAPWLQATLLIQSDAPSVHAMARALLGAERDPARAAELLTHWVFRETRRTPNTRVPNALSTLNSRRGDCNDLTVLYVALARAAGLPTRPVAGLLRIGGRFYYHAWPEVYLGDWVAVDPTLDQFPADGGHLRFVVNGLARQIELLRFLGGLKVDVL